MKIELVGGSASPRKLDGAGPRPRPAFRRGNRGGNRGGRGGRGGGGGGNRNRQQKPVKTAAELDADLDAHNAKMQTD